MKNKQSSLFLSSIAASSILLAPALHAADGTWNVNNDGLWSTSSNWASSIIADGSGSTANFTNDITADRTVSLDGDRTLTSLVFGDSDTATAGSWILNNNGNSTNNLILAGTTPGITVNALGTGKTATISAVIQGEEGLVKSGSGTLVLSGANTYNGTTTINAGTVTMTGGSGNYLGALQINAGTLNVTTRLNFGAATLADVAGATLDFSGVTGTHQILSLSGGGANGGNVVLGNSLYTTGSLSTSYAGIISGTGAFVQGGTGMQTLSGMNTYTGTTSIQKGTLSVSSISSVNGGASSLGNSSDGRIFLGATTNTGTLLYTGSGHSTDRVVSLSGTTGGGTIDASGSGALVFTSNFTVNIAGSKTLTLTGNNTDENRIGGAIVNHSSNGSTSLTKSGTGKWILSGNNTYTGATTVSEGTLLVDGSLAAGSAVTVASGAILGGSGRINGAAVVNGTLQPGNSPGVLTFNGTLTLGTTSAVVMELNGTARGTGYDGIDVTGALTYGGALTIDVDTTLSSNQTFSLFAGSGSKLGNFASASLTGAYTGSFSNSSGVWNLTDSSGNQWSFSQATGNLGFTAVPEPSTYALLAIAGLGLFFAARRRKVQA